MGSSPRVFNARLNARAEVEGADERMKAAEQVKARNMAQLQAASQTVKDKASRLSVVASETLVRVLDGTNEIARHPRSYDAGQQLEDERHLAALTADKRKAREHRGRNRLFAVCPAAKAFLAEIALHGGHLGGTTSRLLRLLDLYGARAVDAAIRDAHVRGAFRAESVAHVLDQRRRADGQKPVMVVAVSDDPRVRDQVVHPHRLDAYDNLAARGTKEEPHE